METPPRSTQKHFETLVSTLASNNHLARLRALDAFADRLTTHEERVAYAQSIAFTLPQRTLSPTARAALARHCGTLRLPTAALINALEERVSDRFEAGRVRKAAAWSLGWIGTELSVEALRTLCAHTDAMHRCAATQALGRLETPSAQDPLLHALEDPSWKVRQHAAIGLGWTPPDRAAQTFEAIQDALSRELHPSVQERLVRALAEVAGRDGHARALGQKTFLRMLEETPPSPNNTPLRRAYIRGLGELQAHEATPMLRAILDREDEHSDVLAQALWALHTLGQTP